MDGKKRILLFGFIVVVLFFGLYSLKQLFVQKPIGGERDGHGCLVAAGYSWCEPKNKCLRTWEEACSPYFEIKNFEDCVKAGYLVLESYPRKCKTPDGNAFTEVVNESGGEEPIGGERDEHGCLTPAGYSWCASKKKCLRVWEEDCPLSEEACTAGGGNWNTCSSKCRLDNQGRDGVVCTMLCEALCECAGIAGFGCPVGYACRTPKGVVDALGYCVPAAAGDASGAEARRLTLEEAFSIARMSECGGKGSLTQNYVYNSNSRTWWIDLTMKPEYENDLCSPACVVSDETKTAEINWRCTGLIQ